MRKKFYFLVFIVVASGCKKLYDPTIDSPATGYLVVEGFINSGIGVSTITLSRTTKLKDTVLRMYEHNAHMSVENDNNETFPLTEGIIGTYTSDTLHINNNAKYRLRISTENGKEYVSEFSAVKYTPPVDSLSWQTENDGLRIYVHTHDAQNLTKYYQWKYDETWEIHAAYHTSLKYTRDASYRITALVYRYPDHSVDSTIYKCWNTLSSTSIILGSSEKLTSDVIYLPVQYIEPASEKLSVLYSMYLKQYALSQDEYQFMQRMKKNTEQIGTLFDAQPSQLSGNIKCITDPNELVIGFVEVTSEQSKRVFIYNNQVAGWRYVSPCVQFELDNNLDSIAKYGTELYPTVPLQLGPGGVPVTFYAANSISCIDCTTRGINRKPVFWP